MVLPYNQDIFSKAILITKLIAALQPQVLVMGSNGGSVLGAKGERLALFQDYSGIEVSCRPLASSPSDGFE
jgi:hypothetical protein